MRINTNVAALNSYNQLKNTQNNLSKSLERLSSGKRINGAADDAAGLAISEKMGGQVRGLGQAQRNAQDAISMNQTAEGALKESHSILQRMRELSVQSANDTNTNEDRAEIQEEVNQLAQELTRIGETTEFNTQKLLDGELENLFHIGANEGQNMELDVEDMRASSLGVAGDVEFETEGEYTEGSSGTDSISDGTFTVEENSSGDYEMIDNDGDTVATSSSGITFEGDATDEEVVFDQAVTGGDVTIDGTGSGSATGTVSVEDTGLEPGTYSVNENDEIVDSSDEVVLEGDGSGTYSDSDGEVLTLEAAIAEDTEINIGGIDVSSQEAADSAISTIDDAIEDVSSERSKLGAVQNRLEHTINNLNTAEENLTAAESRISDVDMAEEMMGFTKNQILSQAGTAMMAQANQLPQGVLQLLG